MLTVLAVTVAISGSGAVLSAQNGPAKPLFRAAATAARDQRLSHRPEIDVVRARMTDLDVAVLEGDPGDLIDLPLFSNARFTARLERTERPGRGRIVWKGHIVGIEDGEVTFAVTDGVLAGQVTIPGAQYRFHRTVEGGYTVEEINPSLLADELPPWRQGIPGGVGRHRACSPLRWGRGKPDRRDGGLYAGGPFGSRRCELDQRPDRPGHQQHQQRLREQRRHSAPEAGLPR
ncbi:MAG TPA: hypothetical protein VNJ04_13550 [Gemmatimonadaceae bacterium]|nr:hypothetical protein [Gemmatimonadaceae bacterium]